MPIEFACESCARLLRVPDGSQGAQCQCPACKAIVEIPDPRSVGMVEVGSSSTRSPAGSRQLQVACPRCRSALRCDASLLGTKGQCRQCKYIFVISTDTRSDANTSAASPSWIFTCPKCRQLFEGTSEMQGRKGKCHACGEVFDINLKPADASEGPAPAPSSDGMHSTKGQLARTAGPAKLPDLQLNCPSCKGIMEVPASAKGKTTACPFCGQLLQIPSVPGQRGAKKTSPLHGTPKQNAGPSGPVAPQQISTPRRVPMRNDTSPSRVPHAEQPKPGPERVHGGGSNSPARPSPGSLSTWDDLSEIDLSASGLSADQYANPYQPPGASQHPGWGAVTAQTNWAAGDYSPSRKGSSFSNVFALVFERAFPNCLAGALVYLLALGAVLGVIYGSLFLTGLTLRALQVRDQTVAITTIVIVLAAASLIGICIATAGFCMLCNGALATMRKKQTGASELFSTGGAFLPMLVYMFTVSVLGAIVGAIPQGLIYLLGPSIALVAALLGLLLSVGYGLLAISLCLAPFAIMDGHPPMEAMRRSAKMFASHPGLFIATILCSFLFYVGVGVVTCGVGSLLLVGFPFYVMAALYCLQRSK